MEFAGERDEASLLPLILHGVGGGLLSAPDDAVVVAMTPDVNDVGCDVVTSSADDDDVPASTDYC